MHNASMPHKITSRLEKRHAVEGDELARDALVAILDLREALQALVVDTRKGLAIARKALAKHR